MSVLDVAAHDRMAASLVGSWAALASCAQDAEVRRVGEADAGIFRAGPAREVFNNALLARGARDVPATLAALREAYGAAGVPGFALWVHESDPAAAEACAAAGWRTEESTRAMALELGGAAAGAGGHADAGAAGAGRAGATAAGGVGGTALGTAAEALHANEIPADLMPAWPADARWHVAREGGEVVSAALALHLDGDCFVSFVGTLPQARRRGHAARVLAALLADAAAAGCTTASLQSTPMAEPLYAAAGFRDLGRFDEWQPPAQRPRSAGTCR